MRFKMVFLSTLLLFAAGIASAQEVIKIRPGQTVELRIVGDGVPAPDPTPTPPPIGPVSKFIIIEETTKAGQFRGEILTAKDIQKFVIAAHLKWRIVDIDAAKTAADIAPQVVEVAGKPLPYLFLVDATGKTLKSMPCPLTTKDFLAVFKPAEPKYALGNVAPKAGLKNKWVKVGETDRIVSIPRDQWKEVSLEAYLPPVRNQGQIGKCNAEATVNAFMTARRISGLSPQDLSDDYLYGQICFRDQWGRRQDNGSLLEDGLKWMTDNGTCTRQIVRDGNWNPAYDFPGSAATEATEFTVQEAYLCPDFAAVASAVQQGFPVVVGIDWSENFFSVDQDGWLPMQRGASAGGHAILCYGVAKRNGVWGANCRNSWGADWGKAGNFVIPEQHFAGMVGGYWAIRSVKQSRPDATANTVVAPKGLFDTFKWGKLLLGIRTAIAARDYVAILGYVEQAATLIGYGNVADDVAAIVKAVQAKDWPALVPPLVDLLEFGLKQFGVMGATPVPEAVQTRDTIELLKASVTPAPMPMPMPQSVAPRLQINGRWHTERNGVYYPESGTLPQATGQTMPQFRQQFQQLQQRCFGPNCPK